MCVGGGGEGGSLCTFFVFYYYYYYFKSVYLHSFLIFFIPLSFVDLIFIFFCACLTVIYFNNHFTSFFLLLGIIICFQVAMSVLFY